MAAALSNMMNFDVDQTINTISISLVPHIALRQTRVGELSMWKAGAAANSARNSIFAALATLYGFTSPREPISGKMGFKNIIVPDLAEDALRKKSSDAIMRTYIKKYPVEYHAQAAVEAALKLANEIDVNRIDSVEIETYEAAVTILADPEKWSPENKETADHSLPFIVASTLLNKDFWTNNYSDIRNENAKSLMKKIKVTEIPEYTKMYPESLPVKIKIKCGDKKYESEVIIPRGHYKNPMDDREVETKFIRLTGMVSAVRDLWNMEDKEVENLV